MTGGRVGRKKRLVWTNVQTEKTSESDENEAKILTTGDVGNLRTWDESDRKGREFNDKNSEEFQVDAGTNLLCRTWEKERNATTRSAERRK